MVTDGGDMRPAIRPRSSQARSTTTAADLAGNRAVGSVELGVSLVDGMSRRQVVRESGSLRVRFPSPEGPALSAVLINTAGGIAGGDRFSVRVGAEDGGNVVVTTAAAEKVYRSGGSRAEVDIRLSVGVGGRIAWLPQETILFDRSRLERRIEIDLAENASLLCAEMVVFGRTAMNERLCQGSYADHWRLRRGRKLVFAETVRLDGNIKERLARPAIAAGGVAVATALIVPGDDEVVARIRKHEKRFGSEIGISAWNGFALLRLCGPDAARLRADIVTLLELVDGTALPRLWLN
jgi:urease accessory protein